MPWQRVCFYEKNIFIRKKIRKVCFFLDVKQLLFLFSGIQKQNRTKHETESIQKIIVEHLQRALYLYIKL